MFVTWSRRAARWRSVLIAAVSAVLTPCAPAAGDSRAERVIVLANSDDPDSLRIARHYADRRGVPAANIVVLKLPLTETITWREFLVTLWQPLLEQLVAAHWIDALPMALTDSIGRRKYAPNRHRIEALVVCRGVPLKIAHDPALFSDVPPFTARGEFRTNAGAVDAELSLLARPNYPITAFVPNPLFQNEKPSRFDRAQVVVVGRLDGPTADDANSLVDRAMAAEEHGLIGRAYVDIASRDNIGDPWLEAVARQLHALGFDPAVDRDAATIAPHARMDAPVLYFGWYAGHLEGPFALPGFRFPPGAIALHIHSFSALTLRSATQGWTGPFVARGVTATVGNVNEPYLQFTHQPHLLLRALARGDSLGEAAYFALTALSWQAVLIGDPLYRPFAVSLGAQLQKRSELPGRLAGYAVLRQMRQLDDAGKPEEAMAAGLAAQRDRPTLAVGLALSQRYHAAGESEAAASALGFVLVQKKFEPDEWALLRESAQLLAAVGRPGRALEVWRVLFAIPSLPSGLRIAWLPEARQAALAANDVAQASTWQLKWNELAAPGQR